MNKKQILTLIILCILISGCIETNDKKPEREEKPPWPWIAIDGDGNTSRGSNLFAFYYKYETTNGYLKMVKLWEWLVRIFVNGTGYPAIINKTSGDYSNFTKGDIVQYYDSYKSYWNGAELELSIYPPGSKAETIKMKVTVYD